MIESGDASEKTAIQIVKWGAAILGMAVVGAVGFGSGKLWDHEVRLSRIEGNRYSSADAVKDNRLIMDALTALRNSITNDLEEHRTWVETNYPPTWLVDDIDELKADVRTLSSSVQSILKR